MASFLDELNSVYKTVYKMKKYTKPKLYKPKKGRWYVYYFYEHPSETNEYGKPKLVRFNCPSLGINARYKKYSDRLEHFKALRDAVEIMLERGYSPFEEGSTEVVQHTVEAAMDYVLNLKKSTIAPKSFSDYSSRVNQFKKFLKKRGYLHSPAKEISRNLCIQFLNEMAKKSSNRNRNNYKNALSAIFSVLEDEEFVDKNYFATIKNLKADPKAHRIYTAEQIEVIFERLKTEPILKLYIEMVSYGFLRPVETCRLKVKDIDIKNAIWTIDAKNKKGKRKRIPDILLTELKKLDLSNPNAFLITNEGVAETDVTPEQRRSTFSKKYNKIRDELGFTNEYDVYSFRHYFTTKVYYELKKKFNHSKALDELQNITGHKTREALMKYLRSIDADIAEDYSSLLE